MLKYNQIVKFRGYFMASLDLVTIGQKLQDARKKSGLTQEQVAELLDINQVQLSYYENGKREINLSLLEKLANLYSYELSYFVTDIAVKEPDIQLAFRGNELNEKDLQTIAWAKGFLNNLEFLRNFK